MNELELQLLTLIIWVAGAGAAAFLLALIWRRILIPVSQKTRTSFDTTLLESADGRIQWLTLAIGAYLGASAAFAGAPGSEMAAIREHAAWRFCLGLLYVDLVFAITCLVYSTIEGMVTWYAETFAEKTHSEVDDRAVLLFHRFAKVVFFFIAVTVVMQHFEVKIGGLLATAGIASLAFALAAKDTLSNLISGVILMFDRPFKRGDRITLPSGGWGDVMEIGLRSTKVLSFEQKVIVIPNAEIARSEIVNHSVPDQRVKIRHDVGVAYGSDMHKVKQIVRSILRAHPLILNDPRPDVFFMGFGDSSLDLVLFFWVGDYREKWEVMDAVNMAIKDRFEAEGIEIPFPQRDIHIRSQAAANSGSAPESGA